VNLHIRPIILFRRQYFFQEVFARLYFLIKITAEKVSNFTGDKGVSHSAPAFFFCCQTTCYPLQKKFSQRFSWCAK